MILFQGHCARDDPFHDPFFGDPDSHPAHLSAEAAASLGRAASRSLEESEPFRDGAIAAPLAAALGGGGGGLTGAGVVTATRGVEEAVSTGGLPHEHVAGVFDGVSTSALFSCMTAVALLQVSKEEWLLVLFHGVNSMIAFSFSVQIIPS